jgi:hypothetical protein
VEVFALGQEQNKFFFGGGINKALGRVQSVLLSVQLLPALHLT